MNRYQIVVTSFFSIVVLAFLTWFGVNLRARDQHVEVLNHGVQTDAVVIGKTVSPAGRSTNTRVQYQFTANDRTFTGTTSVSSQTFNDLHEGQHIEIHYLASDPNQSLYAAHEVVSTDNAVLTSIALCGIVIFGATLLSGLRKKRGGRQTAVS